MKKFRGQEILNFFEKWTPPFEKWTPVVTPVANPLQQYIQRIIYSHVRWQMGHNRGPSGEGGGRSYKLPTWVSEPQALKHGGLLLCTVIGKRF